MVVKIKEKFTFVFLRSVKCPLINVIALWNLSRTWSIKAYSHHAIAKKITKLMCNDQRKKSQTSQKFFASAFTWARCEWAFKFVSIVFFTPPLVTRNGSTFNLPIVYLSLSYLLYNSVKVPSHPAPAMGLPMCIYTQNLTWASQCVFTPSTSHGPPSVYSCLAPAMALPVCIDT